MMIFDDALASSEVDTDAETRNYSHVDIDGVNRREKISLTDLQPRVKCILRVGDFHIKCHQMYKAVDEKTAIAFYG